MRSPDRTYIYVDFHDKDAVKALGGRWDPQAQSWYVPPHADLRRFGIWLSPETLHREAPASATSLEEPTYLRVDCDDYDKVERLGAQWDETRRRWFAPAGSDLKAFQYYLSDEDLAKLPPEIAEVGARANRLRETCQWCSGTGSYRSHGTNWGECYECGGTGRRAG